MIERELLRIEASQRLKGAEEVLTYAARAWDAGEMVYVATVIDPKSYQAVTSWRGADDQVHACIGVASEFLGASLPSEQGVKRGDASALTPPPYKGQPGGQLSWLVIALIVLAGICVAFDFGDVYGHAEAEQQDMELSHGR